MFLEATDFRIEMDEFHGDDILPSHRSDGVELLYLTKIEIKVVLFFIAPLEKYQGMLLRLTVLNLTMSDVS